MLLRSYEKGGFAYDDDNDDYYGYGYGYGSVYGDARLSTSSIKLKPYEKEKKLKA